MPTPIAGRFHRVVAASPTMRKILLQAAKISQTESPILIQGGIGVGKSLLARWIHDQSPRAAGPLLHVFCGSMGGDQVIAALPGHDVKTSWETSPPRPTCLERARGGTLLLDNVDELPHWIQTKLCDALNDHTESHPGSNERVPPDVRVIAATSSDPDRAVARGRFCGRLHGYLSAHSIRIPPLRDRPADIRALAGHFLHQFVHLRGLPAPERQLDFSSQAWECLISYDWPGNVQELASVVKRAVLFSSDQGDGLLGTCELPRRHRAA